MKKMARDFKFLHRKFLHLSHVTIQIELFVFVMNVFSKTIVLYYLVLDPQLNKEVEILKFEP